MIQIINPKKQKEWGWPAVLNFIFGGTAAGLYLSYFLMASFRINTPGVCQTNVVKILAPIMILMGFLVLTAEVGRPLRSRYLFNNRHSWMTLEAIAGAIFVSGAIFDWLSPHLAIHLITAFAAVMFLISQGCIVYRAKAVIAWNVSLMPVLFISSSLTMGIGMVLLLVAIGLFNLGYDLLVIGLTCVVLNLVLWLFYLYRYNDKEFRKSTEAMRRPSTFVIIAGIGHMLPILLLFLLLILLDLDMGNKSKHIAAAIAGLAIIVGGASQKSGIILQCGYLRGIVLE